MVVRRASGQIEEVLHHLLYLHAPALFSVRTKNSAHIAGAAVLDQSTHRISSTVQAALRYNLVHYTLECTCYIKLHMLSRKDQPSTLR